MEAKIKIILNTAVNRHEAQKMLMKENFSADDILRIVQKYYRYFRVLLTSVIFYWPSLYLPNRRNSREDIQQMCINDLKSNFSSSNASPNKKPLTPKDQQMQLSDFAQNVHMLNQEIHKNLRHNKAGVQMKNIEKLPADYKRPPGFLLIPGLLGSIPGGDHHILNLIQANGKSINSFETPEDQAR